MYISPVQRERHRQTKSLPKNIDKMMHVIEKNGLRVVIIFVCVFCACDFSFIKYFARLRQNQNSKTAYRRLQANIYICMCVCVCVNYLTVSCELLLKCHQQQLHSGEPLEGKVRCSAS